MPIESPTIRRRQSIIEQLHRATPREFMRDFILKTSEQYALGAVALLGGELFVDSLMANPRQSGWDTLAPRLHFHTEKFLRQLLSPQELLLMRFPETITVVKGPLKKDELIPRYFIPLSRYVMETLSELEVPYDAILQEHNKLPTARRKHILYLPWSKQALVVRPNERNSLRSVVVVSNVADLAVAELLLREKPDTVYQKQRVVWFSSVGSLKRKLRREIGKKRKYSGNFSPYEITKRIIHLRGIKNWRTYRHTQQQERGFLPSHPNRIYHDTGWKSAHEFFGKEKESFLPYDAFEKEVRESGISSKSQYEKEYKKHVGWPASPPVSYENHGWKSWRELLQKEKKEFLSYEAFEQEVRKSKISSASQYKRKYKKHAGWPSNPDRDYKNRWVSWRRLFGKSEN